MDECLNYAQKGWIEALDSFLKKSEAVSLDNYLPSVQDAVTAKGKVYCLPHTFYVGTLMLPESATAGRRSWTIEEHLDFLEQYPDSYFSASSTLEGVTERRCTLLTVALRRGIEGFLDVERGTVDLDNERFRSVLERINNLEIHASAGTTLDDYKRRVLDGEVLLTNVTLDRCGVLNQSEREQREKIVLIGFPTAEKEKGGQRIRCMEKKIVIMNMIMKILLRRKRRKSDVDWIFGLR